MIVLSLPSRERLGKLKASGYAIRDTNSESDVVMLPVRQLGCRDIRARA